MRIWAKAILSIAILAWLVHLVSFSEIAANVTKTNWTSFLVVWLVQSALVLVQATRWRIIARRLGIDFPFWPACQNVYIGQFFNQVFPSSIGGDAVRAWRLHRSSVPINAAIASVALERIVALFAVPVIAILGLGVLLDLVPPGSLRWGLLALLLGFAGGLLVLLSVDRVPLPRRLARVKVVRLIQTLPVWARRVFLSWRTIGSTTVLSVIIHAAIGTSFWILAQSLGVRAPLLDFVVLAPLVMLITAVPVSIGGWGVREGAMITAMSLIEVPGSTSLTVSIEFGFLMILVGLPGGLIWLLDSDQPEILTTVP
jgi:uncharacterized membrane protein YbhN (UPF0104 family)